MRPATLTIRVFTHCPKGQCFLMAAPHPEVDPLTPVAEAEARLLLCHPDDERRLRDAWAILQERPEWWGGWARLQQIVGFIAGAEYDMEVAGMAEGIEKWLAEN